MLRYIILLVILFMPLSFVSAQRADSVFVSFDHEQPSIQHTIFAGETIFMLARRYHVPPAVLADFNELTYQSGLEKDKKIAIPLGTYNYITVKPSGIAGFRPLYYRVTAKDNLYRISKNAGLQQRTIQEWNKLADNAIETGQTLLIGWLLYEPKETPAVAPQSIPPVKEGTITRSNGVTEKTIVIEKEDTVRAMSPVEQQYMEQTNNEQNMVEEKGAAVFFIMSGKLNSTKTIYAFHNTAAKGTIIKVFNPGTGRTVFVKVLGPIPGTKQYHNSIIGIGSGAKAILGIGDNRTWCELKYAGY